MFSGRDLIIATKHKKEKVITPLIRDALGVNCLTIPDLDTDLLGTFSGEFQRLGNPLETLRKKCLLAIDTYNCDLLIASEGSFGPHPLMPFVAADDEWLMLMDRRNDLEIVVREISTETNFNAKTVLTENELLEFAHSVHFPSHALILKAAKDDFSGMQKGIQNEQELVEAFHRLYAYKKSVYVETDMRAMYNPSRMKVIESATHKLIAKINSSCPQCQFPGFDVVEVIPGLRCEVCHCATSSTLKHKLQCARCKYTEELLYPKGKKVENPMYCDYCNP
jgi:hypothetical protein